MKSYLKTVINILQNSLEQLDEKIYDQLLDEMNETVGNGNKIIVSGLGKNVPICEKFVGTMVSLGMDAYFLHTDSAVHGDMGIVKNDDLVILLSKSGETVETVYLAELLKARHIKLWGMTFKKHCKLSELVDGQLVISLEHEGDKWNIVPNNSTTLNLIILQSLAIQLAEKQCIDLNVFKNNHPGGQIGVILRRGEE